MEILYSVIIPTQNRAGQLQLTLCAFEKQTFPHNQFEVIVVDDCSTDHTSEIVKEFENKYPFQYIHLDERKGQGVARNIGATHAKGKILIFCDSDLLVLPDFLTTFHTIHCMHENVIISGTPYCFNSIYTHYFPDFSSQERKIFMNVVRRSSFWSKLTSLIRARDVSPVITSKDLRENFDCIQQLVLQWEVVPDDLKAAFLNTEISPWLLFITRCISLPKDMFISEGGFDPRLIRGEDWELGYRLYKKGYSFKSVEKTIGYHQEHPHKRRNPHFRHAPFYVYLYEKYGIEDPELTILSLWDSSDDLWNHIQVYKRVLSNLRNSHNLTDEQHLLLKDCRYLADKRLQEFHS